MSSNASVFADLFKTSVSMWNSTREAKYTIPESGLGQGSHYRMRTLSSRARPVEPISPVPRYLIERGSLPVIRTNILIEGMTGSMAPGGVMDVGPTQTDGTPQNSAILTQLQKQREQFNSILEQYNSLVTNPPMDASSNQSYQTEVESVNQMLISIAKDMYQNVEFADKEMKGDKTEIEATMKTLLQQVQELNGHGTKHDSYQTTMRTLETEQRNIEEQQQMSNYAFYGLTAGAVILSVVVLRQFM